MAGQGQNLGDQNGRGKSLADGSNETVYGLERAGKRDAVTVDPRVIAGVSDRLQRRTAPAPRLTNDSYLGL